MSDSTSKDDLDNFLTLVESKLRGPFSSLDLAKAVTASRDTSPAQYLQKLRTIFPRMADKVTMLRTLIAMLGLDPSKETDETIYKLYTEAPEEERGFEWVKVVAGLSRGILFQDGDGSRESCRGEEAQRLLEKSCRDVMEGIQESDDVDTEPLFSPHFYSLLNPDALKQVLPESLVNKHFQLQKEADILQEDERIEQKKLQDTKHLIMSAQTKNGSGEKQMDAKPKAQRDLPTMPGMRKIGKAKTVAAASSASHSAKGSSSMFMPTKRQAGSAATSRAQLPHMRKKTGTARAILAKGRAAGARAHPAGGGTSSARSNPRFGGNKSKMKMMDLDEVKGLQAQRGTVTSTKDARKRKLMEQAKAKGLVKKAKVATTVPDKPAGAEAVGAEVVAQEKKNDGDPLVAAALAAYQQKQQPSAAPGSSTSTTAGDWTQHLEKSNKLSPEDKERIRKFFVDRINPTPDQPIYRMKLHEEKTIEEGTGLTVKETLYLELDYNDFSFKKLRKRKKK